MSLWVCISLFIIAGQGVINTISVSQKNLSGGAIIASKTMGYWWGGGVEPGGVSGVLVCVGIHEENQNGRRLLVHCSSLRTDLEKQKLRLQNMSGKHLDSASPFRLYKSKCQFIIKWLILK